jgi:ATP-dependent Clp protease ATP-binding subunit ClpX
LASAITLIAGPDVRSAVYICDECIELCNDIIAEESIATTLPARQPAAEALRDQGRPRRVRHRPGPRQEGPLGRRAQPLQAHRGGNRPDDVELQKSNILLIGPTGTGKTLLAQTLARILNVPFAIADATTLTEAGYVGEDVENIILSCSRTPTTTSSGPARHRLHRRDRQDRPQGREPVHHPRRLGRGRAAGPAEDHRGHVANVPPKGGRKHPQQEFIQVDTTNILFICGGAFVGPRADHRAPGRREDSWASAPTSPARRRAASWASCSRAGAARGPACASGLIPEFIGRLPVVATLDELDEDALIDILTEPKNALVKQYQKLFAPSPRKALKRASRRARPPGDPRARDARLMYEIRRAATSRRST